ncbi:MULTISPECIES: lytic transglycosylase domain-containing protein [Paracoccus]|uniref:Transglycosylase SLT domain-containing protein n=1 Tax=Paracoccus litorisediminis TaxID=2006130 RepID=A0A844HK63_9RHOB|nr:MULTISPECIES: lytic transglycosylase domain-containing protein [Paracoccus]MBD9526364.1 lytic transglycosylase domain-containing protein [Paracoccus sp. PAR01]MTH58767.1 transglycosylase SLT domain-containing protein [Paracoccus litorisediminis]
MRFLVIALIAAFSAAQVGAYEAVDAVNGTPAPQVSSPKSRCTDDGRYCISVANYVPDVCSAIERAAGHNGIDPHFFARLLWKESLFEPGAISPVGAQGIAQFMPGTAEMVGLDDPFNPAKAIAASARYLRSLTDGFGNIGLAAVAYNGGENRASRYVSNGGGLPWETQDYVQAITGMTAAVWRDSPPKEMDLRLDKQRPFLPACIDLAASRKLREFKTPERVWPWGVIVATHPSQSGVNSQVSRLNKTLRPILGGKRISYVRRKISGGPRRVYTAQIGYSSRTEAYAFCSRLRSFGGRCIVLKN